ncbi:MAG TPA: phosphatase PAP2 family protein [Planctomycetes bacterium]|nr:phosphatase PAP2 family protein [Planctomycetota bacterium]
MWLAIGLWLAATRVLMAEHWPTDTIAGFLLGAFSVALVASILQRKRAAQDSARNHSSIEMVSPLE